MLKKLSAILTLSGLLLSGAYADDILSIVSKGQLTSKSAGVKELSLEEKMQVKGGYQVLTGNVSDYMIGNSLRITEAMAIAVPTIFELSTGGVCDMGVTSSCYIPGSELAYGKAQHYTSSINRYKELMSATNNNPTTQFIAFTIKRTMNWSNPYRPTVQYTTGAATVGINNGAIYKINSNLSNNSIVREMSYRYQQQLKNGMGI